MSCTPFPLFSTAFGQFLVSGFDERQGRRTAAPTASTCASRGRRSGTTRRRTGCRSVRQRRLDLVERLALLNHRSNLVSALSGRVQFALEVGFRGEIAVAGDIRVGVEGDYP